MIFLLLPRPTTLFSLKAEGHPAPKLWSKPKNCVEQNAEVETEESLSQARVSGTGDFSVQQFNLEATT